MFPLPSLAVLSYTSPFLCFFYSSPLFSFPSIAFPSIAFHIQGPIGYALYSSWPSGVSYSSQPSLLPLLPVHDSPGHAPLVPTLILEEFVDSLVKVRGTCRLLSPAARIIALSHPYLVAKEPPSTPFVHPLQPKAGSLHTQISGGVRLRWSFFARWTRDHKSDRAISYLSDLPILKRHPM
jgi:hypothetical protein